MPHSTSSVVSTSGPSVRATVTPVPKNPWYSPTRSAGARSKESCQDPADCPISATTCSTAPTTRAPTATHGEAPADSANTAQAASMTHPDRRTARVADASPVTPRAIRTWNTITAPVLSTNSAETSQVGAAVRSAIHSGIPRLSNGIRSSRTVFSRVITAYGRSRSTPEPRSFSTGTRGATDGSRSSSPAHTTKLTASTANTPRYAARVPACNASPPSPAPTASPALSVAWRWVSNPVRSPADTSPASSACRAAASPDCAEA
ncbi:UNVERIFIED_CONTAM: mRNA-degrading endonuclease toxin of MazEF toxin-antitoxin module [Streptomyces canus]